MDFFDWDNLFYSYGTSASSSQKFVKPSWLEKDDTESQNLFNQTLLEIFEGRSEDNAGPYKLRYIVEQELLYVPTNADGTFKVTTLKKGERARLIAAPSKQDGRRTDRVGVGGRVISVFTSKLEGDFAQFDGRSFVRSLPPDIDGMLVEYQDEQLELGREYFAQLSDLCTAVELEDQLLAANEIDTEFLRKSKFRLATINGNLWRSVSILDGNVVAASTHEDSEYFDEECKVKIVSGAELFKAALDDDAFDGISINSSSTLGRQGLAVKHYLMSPNFLKRALEQDRCFLTVKDAVVRSHEEFLVWLKLNDFPEEYEILEVNTADGRKLVRAVSKPTSGTKQYRTGSEIWRTQQLDDSDDSPVVSFTHAFEIRSTEESSPGGLGSGASQVLCPGLLARDLAAFTGTSNKSKLGKSFLFGRMMSDDDIAKSKQKLVLAQELLKLIPEGADSIPRTSCLTVGGASYLSMVPKSASREWINSVIEKLQRNCSKVVWGS